MRTHARARKLCGMTERQLIEEDWVAEIRGAAHLFRGAEDPNRTGFCIYDAPTPKAVRKAAARHEPPVDQIIGVLVLVPYLYS